MLGSLAGNGGTRANRRRWSTRGRGGRGCSRGMAGWCWRWMLRSPGAGLKGTPSAQCRSPRGRAIARRVTLSKDNLYRIRCNKWTSPNSYNPFPFYTSTHNIISAKHDHSIKFCLVSINLFSLFLKWNVYSNALGSFSFLGCGFELWLWLTLNSNFSTIFRWISGTCIILDYNFNEALTA